MPNGYPPGVTGNEPQITGEIEVDPHAPFWVGEDPEDESQFAVFYGAEEDLWWGAWVTKDGADAFAAQLNSRWSLKEPNPDKNGQCRICGDYHDEAPWMDADD